MATTTKKQTGAKAAPAKRAAKRPATPRQAITDAAVGLEHDILAALRDEVAHLRKTIETIESDVRAALKKIEKAIDGAPSANRKKAKAPAARKSAKAPAARKSAKAPAKRKAASTSRR